MCIIVQKPKGVTLDKGVYAECFHSNSDGAGIAYVNDENQLTVEKGFFTNADALCALIDKLGDRDMLIHFRVSTHGVINEKNCHPFFVPSKANGGRYSYAIAHNGQLPWRSTKDESDTFCFIHELLAPHLQRDPYFFESYTGRLMIESIIGEKNKIVVMRHDSKALAGKNSIHWAIMNSSAGMNDMGCWFSNGSYIPWKGPKSGSLDIRRNPNFVDRYRKSQRTKEEWDLIGMVEDPKYTNVWVSATSMRGKEILREQKEKAEGKVIVPFVNPGVQTHVRTVTSNASGTGGASSKTKEEKEMEDRLEAASNLYHLNIDEKKHLRALAYEFYCKHFEMCKSAQLSNAEMILYMRDEVSHIMQLDRNLGPGEIDKFILIQDMKGESEKFCDIFRDKGIKDQTSTPPSLPLVIV